MKKRTLVEIMLDECPNCGAARKGEEEVCTFCGSSMIQKQRVTEDVEETQVQGESKIDNRKVDIVSEVVPLESGGGFVAVVIFLVVWCVMAFGIGVVAAGSGAPGIFAIMPFLIGGIGVVGMWSSLIGPALRTKRVLSEGKEYSAEVLGYSRKTVERRYGSNERTEREEQITVKVLATIDGREQCILLNAPDSVSELSHPVGCRITIVGYDNDFLMKV